MTIWSDQTNVIAYCRFRPQTLVFETINQMLHFQIMRFITLLPLNQSLYLALLTGATHSTNNKLYLGQAGMSYSLEDILDPESLSILYPFTIGAKQKITVGGVEVEVCKNIYQVRQAGWGKVCTTISPVPCMI